MIFEKKKEVENLSAYIRKHGTDAPDTLITDMKSLEREIRLSQDKREEIMAEAEKCVIDWPEVQYAIEHLEMALSNDCDILSSLVGLFVDKVIIKEDHISVVFFLQQLLKTVAVHGTPKGIRTH